VITVPTFAHAELAVLAAGAGKHIFCEKPMALTLEECDSMPLRKDGRRRLPGRFRERFQPEFLEPSAGSRLATSHANGRQVPHRARGYRRHGTYLRRSNGMLAEEQPRLRLRALAVGSEISGSMPRRPIQGHERGVTAPDFYDNVVVSLRFASGALGTIDGPALPIRL